jgi:hypothetical protein
MFNSETWLLLRAGAACAAVAVVIATIIRDRGGEPEDVTVGFLGPSLAALYLLVLAVSLATEWQSIGDASTSVTTEASAVRDLYWSAEGLPPAEQAYVESRTRAYAITVIHHDWPQMQRGTLDDRSEQELISLNNYVLRINPATQDASNSQQQATDQLSTLFSVHDERAGYVGQRLPEGLLAAVIATSLVVGAFPFLCGMSTTRRSTAIAAIQAALVGVGIVVVFQLNHVYTGPLGVSSSPMQSVLQQITVSTSQPKL